MPFDKKTDTARKSSCVSTVRRLATHFQKVHNEHPHMSHCFLLEMAEFRMRLCIEGEETTDVDVTFRCERRTGIKPESWLSYHERKVFIPLVLTQVIGNHKVVFSSFSIGLFQSDSILSVPERATVSYEIACREQSGEIRIACGMSDLLCTYSRRSRREYSNPC